MTAPTSVTVEPIGPSGLRLLRGVRHRDDRGFLRKVVVLEEARRQGVGIVVDGVVGTINDEARRHLWSPT